MLVNRIQRHLQLKKFENGHQVHIIHLLTIEKYLVSIWENTHGVSLRKGGI